jgi:hypothetical protein
MYVQSQMCISLQTVLQLQPLLCPDKFRRAKTVQTFLTIMVITKLPNSEQSYKGKVKTHKYINKQNQSTTGKWQTYERFAWKRLNSAFKHSVTTYFGKWQLFRKFYILNFKDEFVFSPKCCACNLKRTNKFWSTWTKYIIMGDNHINTLLNRNADFTILVLDPMCLDVFFKSVTMYKI